MLLPALLMAAVLVQPSPPRERTPATPVPTVPKKPVIDPEQPAESEAKSNVKALQTISDVNIETKVLNDHPWAGQYYQGNGSSINITLALAPKAGAAFVWRGTTGTYGSGSGTVSEDKGWLTLAFPTQFGSTLDSSVYVPVNWGKRRYLIAREEMNKFCNAVNLGSEPRAKEQGLFFFRAGDENREASGLPSVPPEYRERILSAPVTATVVSVERMKESIDGKWDSKSYRVTLDKGNDAGLRTEMTMLPVEPRTQYDSPITESTASTCVVTYTWSSWMGKHLEKPAVGWTFTTRRPPVKKAESESKPEADQSLTPKTPRNGK